MDPLGASTHNIVLPCEAVDDSYNKYPMSSDRRVRKAHTPYLIQTLNLVFMLKIRRFLLFGIRSRGIELWTKRDCQLLLGWEKKKVCAQQAPSRFEVACVLCSLLNTNYRCDIQNRIHQLEIAHAYIPALAR